MPLRLAVLAAFALSPVARPPHARADAPPAGEQPAKMRAWLDTLETQWQAVYDRDVKAPRETAEIHLWQEYLAGVDKGIAQASAASNLELALAFRNERDRLAKAKDMPAEDAPGTPAALSALRATWRAQNTRNQNEHAARAKAFFATCDQVLGPAQAELTRQGRLDDALLVKTKREELAKAWLPPASLATPPAASASAVPPTPSPALTTGQVIGMPNWHQLAERIDKKECLPSGIAGHKRDRVVEDLGDSRSILVGFDILITPFNDSRETVRGLRPVFFSDKGESVGGTYGERNSKNVRHVVAKPGYAVGAVSVQFDGNACRRIKVRFDRIQGLSLDPKDSYNSGWIGIYSSLAEGTSDTDGRLPVGINVCFGLGVDGLGLITVKP